MAVVGFLALLYPRASANPLEAVNPANPPAVLITISNDNFYMLRDVQYSCIQVEGSSSGAVYQGNLVGPRDTKIDNLVSYDSATISCAVIGEEFPAGVVTRDFMVTVSFRPFFVPALPLLRSERSFRFVAVHDQEGHPRVVRQPQVYFPQLERFRK
jgi:hypothetical protein